jgi:hypothetical protein
MSWHQGCGGSSAPMMCLVLNEQGHKLILHSQQLLNANRRTWRWWWCIAMRGLPTPMPMCCGSLWDIEHIINIGPSMHHMPQIALHH